MSLNKVFLVICKVKMFLKLVKLFLFVSVVDLSLGLGIKRDYCDPNLCPPPFHKHTACEATGEFAANCPDNIEVVTWTDAQKFAMVDLHNYYRMLIAGGSVETYATGQQQFLPSATRMLKLVRKL